MQQATEPTIPQPLEALSDEHGPAIPAPVDKELVERIQRNTAGRQARLRMLVEAIMHNPGIRASDLADQIRIPASTISQDILPLVELGLMYKRPAKGGGFGLFFFTHREQQSKADIVRILNKRSEPREPRVRWFNWLRG